MDCIWLFDSLANVIGIGNQVGYPSVLVSHEADHVRYFTGREFGLGYRRQLYLRIVTLKLNGRPIAFVYYFVLEGRMYCYRLAFDPEFQRFSPGVVNRFDALETAFAEGATRVEFLGGAERYKMELADRFEPLYEGLGLARSVPGRAALAGRVNAIRLRRFLKRSASIRRFYYEGLAPARRLFRVGGRT